MKTDDSMMMTLSQAEKHLLSYLIHPWQSMKSFYCRVKFILDQRRASWHQRIADICELAISYGFLPHCNAGPLSYEEMEALGKPMPVWVLC